ncbi:hypothetical protein ACE1OE_19905 [Vibrio sp. E150_011]
MWSNTSTLEEFVQGFDDDTEWVLEDDLNISRNWNTRIYFADYGEHDQSFLCHIQYERAEVEGELPRVLIATEDC